MKIIGLDFETYSAANLPEVGLYNYIEHETFRPLIAAVARPDGSTELFDFSQNKEFVLSDAAYRLKLAIGTKQIAAHNAAFEQAVLRRIGIDLPSSRFIDSAVLARACGYGSSLEAAAPQVLGIDKLASGKDLIMLFSVPGKYQEAHGTDHFVPVIVLDHPDEWDMFKHYCALDAELSLKLVERLLVHVPEKELDYAAITLDMNNEGWPVDLGLVKEMKARYRANVRDTELRFRLRQDEDELNLNSHKQLVEWCEKRGVRAKSFDEKHVVSLIERLEKRVAALPDSPKTPGYKQVLDLLRTKRERGGSSLKKLDTILGTASWRGRLYDQYLHIGAGATWRTTGRGVQMQNLKRLMGEGDDVEILLADPDTHWDNDRLARNLRQVFAPIGRQDRLIVGDFASVESRGLAWQAGEQWKLDAYRRGDDLYKVQAGLIYGKDPSGVTKDERQIGKVAELACGYGAGGQAVRDFAAGMGTELTESEAADLVKRWRAANPEIVQYWQELDAAMHRALDTGATQSTVQKNMLVRITPLPAPESLSRQTGDAGLVSLWFEMFDDRDALLLSRVVHGVHTLGRNVGYWKPSDRKTGDLWKDRYTDPKTGLIKPYSLYGGKLAGLMTQSLCREVFFQVLADVAGWVDMHPNLRLIGQFHDEIVLEWLPNPTGIGLDSAMVGLEVRMSQTSLSGFPLAAAVKADHRYTK